MSSVSAIRSLATATSRPAACAFSMILRRSRTSPRSSGYCSSSPNARSIGRSSGSPISSRMLERLGAPFEDVERLRERPRRHEEHRLLPRRRLLRIQPVEHRHRFGGGGAFVEQRRRRDLHPGEIADHRLEVQQRLEAPLRDLGLVRRSRACTSRGSRTRCAGSRRACACRSSPSRCRSASPCSSPRRRAAGAGSPSRSRPAAGSAPSRNGCRTGWSARSARRACGHADGAQHLLLRRRIRDRCGGT